MKILSYSMGILCLIVCFSSLSYAQGIGINDDNSNPDASAMLDVKSTTKGMLVPRMNSAQRGSIATPATGLLVFDNTTNTFWFYNGTIWIELLAGIDSDNQNLALAGNTLSISGGNSVNLTGFTNTDNQDLELLGNTLSLTNDGTTVDLSAYLDNTDAQNLTLLGNNLSIQNGNTVDLSAFANTDNQDLSLAGNTLSLTNDGTTVNLSTYLDNTDNQDLSLLGNTLSLTNDGTTVDLSTYLDNTDAQNLTLLGNNLSIQNGNTVDLSAFVSTDDQDIQGSGLTGSTLTIGIEGGANETVDLSSLLDNTDNQDLSLTGNNLTLTNDGTPVNLSGYLDNTDNQTLSIAGQNLTIAGGNTVALPAGSDDQNIQGSGLTGSTLTIGIEGGTNETVNLSSLLDNTDNQDLSLTGNNLTLTNDGTPVNLSGYLDNTDDQNIQGSGLAGSTLTIGIEGGANETVNLSSLLDNTDNQTLSYTGNTLSIQNGNSVTIPNGDITGVTAGAGITGGGTTGNVTVTAAANNGLNVDAAADRIQLGGALVEGTTITQGANNMVFNLNGTGDFHIQDNGATRFLVQDNGDVRADNTTFMVDASTNNVGIGTAAPAQDLHVFRPDTDVARVYATGTTQGSGMFYAGQSTTYGGGFVYDGDGAPALIGGTDRITFFRRSNGTDSDVMSYAQNSSILRVTNLAGTGNRMVIANANGDLSTQAITVGDITGVTAGDGLTGGGTTGNVTLNVVATNGLTDNANDIRLGGALIQATTITQGAHNMTHNLNGAGDFIVQDNAINKFVVVDDGNSLFGGDVYWRDENTGGTNLMTLLDDGNDGRLRIYENGGTSVDLDANSQFVFNEQGLDRDFRIESDIDANMFRVNAGLNRVGIGDANPTTRLEIGVNTGQSLMLSRQDGTITNGEQLGGIGFDGSDGNTPDDIREASASIIAFASEDHGTGDKGGRLTFWTSPNNQDDDTDGIERFRIDQNGTQYIAGDAYWRDATIGGTTLMLLSDDANDGRLRIYENGATSVDLDANSQFVFNEQGLDRDFRVESDGNANMFRVDAANNRVGIGTSIPAQALHIIGTARVSNLAGTGNRMVITNANGDLATQAIPANGDITGVTAGDGLTGGGNAGTVTLNVVATNGLTDAANDVRLGGTLVQNTAITQAGFNMTYNLNGLGDFIVQDNGVNQFVVQDNGDVRADNTTFFVDASTNRVGINTTTPDDAFDVNGDIVLSGGVRSIETQINDRSIELDDANPTWFGETYGGVVRIHGDNDPNRGKLETGGLQVNRKMTVASDATIDGTTFVVDAADNRIGVLQATPTSDLHLKMSASPFPNPTTGGITMENALNTNEWQIWNSNPYCSFAYNNTRVAYVNSGSGAWTVTSDKRWKKDIENMSAVLAGVMSLRPVKYRYNHNEDDATKTIGFLAQEVQEVFPDLVYSEDGTQLALAPSDYGILSIKAIQEQQTIIEDQKSKIATQESQIEELKAKQAQTEQELKEIKALLEKINK